MNKKIIFALAIGLLLIGGVAFGAEAGGKITLTNPLKCPTLGACIDKLIDALFVLAAPLCALMVMVGGYQILFAAGDPEKFKTGKQTLTYAMIGFALLVLAKSVQYIILDVFGAS